MNEETIDILVADWDDVYKKGQLSLWILLAIADGKKYAAIRPINIYGAHEFFYKL